MQKFIKAAEFKDTYGEDELNNFYRLKFEGAILPSAFRKEGKFLYIDKNFFLKRKKFQRKIWLTSHDNYFFLTLHSSSLEIARLLHKIDDSHSIGSWNMFMAKELFCPISDRIMSFKTEGKRMKFYRYSRWLIRALFIKAGVKPVHRDIKVLLDRD